MNKTFTLTIDLNDDAFTWGCSDTEQTELADILRRLADRIKEGAQGGKVHSTDGNTVGRFDIVTEPPKEWTAQEILEREA